MKIFRIPQRLYMNANDKINNSRGMLEANDY